jgi:hypothetical protein
MTELQSLYIKWLRIRCDGTWRWIDLMYRARYVYNLPYNESFHTNCSQFIGKELCNISMDVLNEKVEDGWN